MKRAGLELLLAEVVGPDMAVDKKSWESIDNALCRLASTNTALAARALASMWDSMSVIVYQENIFKLQSKFWDLGNSMLKKQSLLQELSATALTCFPTNKALLSRFGVYLSWGSDVL